MALGISRLILMMMESLDEVLDIEHFANNFVRLSHLLQRVASSMLCIYTASLRQELGNNLSDFSRDRAIIGLEDHALLPSFDGSM